MLINYCASNPKKKVTVVAETIPAVKEGAVTQFKEIMEETGRWFDDRFNMVELTYTFGNGTRIQFKSFDTEGKAKAAGKRDVLFINEANHIHFNIAHALMIRTEGDIWIDYNPDDEFWAHTEIMPQPDSSFCLLKYTDNEGCKQTIIDELLLRQKQALTSAYWANWCKVYIDGEIGNLQGMVFENWKQCDSIPKHAEFICYALDFGFTNDETGLISVYEADGELYCKELIYQTRMTNKMIAAKFSALGITEYDEIIADSADPKSIYELRELGFNVIAAKKGPDSIKASIDKLQQYTINITSDSLNFIRELRAYRWLTDESGKQINKPVDGNNHLIDPLRYAALNKIGKGASMEFSTGRDRRIGGSSSHPLLNRKP